MSDKKDLGSLPLALYIMLLIALWASFYFAPQVSNWENEYLAKINWIAVLAYLTTLFWMFLFLHKAGVVTGCFLRLTYYLVMIPIYGYMLIMPFVLPISLGIYIVVFLVFIVLPKIWAKVQDISDGVLVIFYIGITVVAFLKDSFASGLYIFVANYSLLCLLWFMRRKIGSTLKDYMMLEKRDALILWYLLGALTILQAPFFPDLFIKSANGPSFWRLTNLPAELHEMFWFFAQYSFVGAYEVRLIVQSFYSTLMPAWVPTWATDIIYALYGVVLLDISGSFSEEDRVDSENASRNPLPVPPKITVHQCIYSPDGKILALSTSVGIYLYDAHSLEVVLYIKTNSDVNCIAFAPSGGAIASGSYNGKVELWEVSHGKLINSFLCPNSVTSIAISLDEKMFAASYNGIPRESRELTLQDAPKWKKGTVRVWRVSDKKMICQFDTYEPCIWSVAFAPNEETLAAGTGSPFGNFGGGFGSNSVRLWNISDRRLVREYSGHAGQIRTVAFSPNGAVLAAGGDDRTIELWQVKDRILLYGLEGHKDSIRSIAFAPNSEILASGSNDGTVRLYRVSDGVLLRVLKCQSEVTCVAFAPNGETLISAHGDSDGVRFWQTSNGELLSNLKVGANV